VVLYVGFFSFVGVFSKKGPHPYLLPLPPVRLTDSQVSTGERERERPEARQEGAGQHRCCRVPAAGYPAQALRAPRAVVPGPPMLRAAAVEAHLCSASPPSEARASTAGHLLLQRRPATAAGPPAAVRATTERASERERRGGEK
jgi:hypothetical protein